MTARSCIEELAAERLLGRRPQCVSFVDALLNLAQEVGEIQCTSSASDRLRFLIPAQPPAFEVEVDAAVSKLRMMCARLGVLCNESGQDVSLYGGEGFIERSTASDSPAPPESLGMEANGPSFGKQMPAGVSLKLTCKWSIRFKNTMHEHEFTITNSSE